MFRFKKSLTSFRFRRLTVIHSSVNYSKFSSEHFLTQGLLSNFLRYLFVEESGLVKKEVDVGLPLSIGSGGIDEKRRKESLIPVTVDKGSKTLSIHLITVCEEKTNRN